MIWKFDALNRATGSALLGAILLIGGATVATAQGRGRGAGKVSPPGGRGEIMQPSARPARPETPMKPSHPAKPNEPAKAKPAKPVPNNRHRDHKRCVKACNGAHKTAVRACRGRTGADRAACERAANETHRNCVQGCPR